MPSDRTQIRGIVLAEDRRTERFFRHLLVSLGFDKVKFRFETAPSGKGNAGVWVRSRYPIEVRTLRAKKHQRELCLVAVRDGDKAGVVSTKADLENSLSEAGLEPRQHGERITTAIPTWSIETWLLALLGNDDLDETASRKREFEQQYPRGSQEARALKDAAQEWSKRANQVPNVPSLADGNAEMSRIDSA